MENNYNLLISKNDQWLQAQERDAAVAIFDGDEEKADLYLEGRREGELTGRKESGADLVDSLLHPIDTLVDSAVGIWEVATDPKGTYDQVVISYNDWEELLAYAMENDPKAAGEMLGIVAGNVEFNAGLTMLTMGGGAAISSSGKLGQLLQKLAKDKQSSSSSSSSLSSSSGNSNQSNSGFGKPEQTSDNKTNASKKGNNQNESKFKSPELLDSHYDKHANEMKVVFNKKNYTKQDYLNDADFVKKEGTYVPELNGYVKLVGGEGRAKYAFVGVDRKTGDITTFHFKTASELSKTAPSLGINK